MKIIFKLSIVIVFAVIIASCTDESDLLDNKPIKNKKTGEGELYVRPYPAYDTISYSSEETYSMLSEFNEVINSESTLEDMSIGKAMYILEAYTNYGVIDKANSVGEEANDVFRTFELELPVFEGQIDGAAIKERYQSFIVSFLNTMRGKVIPMADMYVKELSSTSVTFGLDINPSNVPIDPNYQAHFPEFYQPNDAITALPWIQSDWQEWMQNGATPWQTPWITKNGYILTNNDVKEKNVYRYSMKITSGGYNNYYTGVQYADLTLAQGEAYYEIEVENQLVSIDYLEFQNTVIPDVIATHASVMTNYVQNWLGYSGMTLCDYIPYLRYTERNIGNPVYIYLLHIPKFTFAYKHTTAPPVMYFNDAFDIADIHPEL